jgi:hypothetical protein
VEAPGAAPGSERFIAAAIYFHSRRTGTPNIGCKGSKKQSLKAALGMKRWQSVGAEKILEPAELGWLLPGRRSNPW